MIDKKQRRENLREFRRNHCRRIKNIMKKQNMTFEELSELSKIPPHILKQFINGEAELFGSLHYFVSCLNKKMKIKLFD